MRAAHSITKQIVESVLQEGRKHKAKKVAEVHLIIGSITFIGHQAG